MREDGDELVKNMDDLREVLSVVSDRVPSLLRGLRDVLYSKEAAENMAGAVATFYKKLVEAGIPSDEALRMAKGYMINLRDLVGSKGFGINLGRRDGDDD
jgi:hypothetical protein